VSIDLIQELRELLDDHRHLNLRDQSNVDYLAGLIEQMVNDQPNDQQMDLFQGTTSEKISQHKIDGIKYSEFAHLSTDRPDEVRRDGDGKKLTDDFPLENKRRVKSYGFFKNEYYDD